MSHLKKLHLSITDVLRGAGGGGGGSPRQPIESPDSLRSIAYARIVDLVSEGEIVGFADQENPMSCVYLNETPVANADGSLNFRNIQVDSRVGTQTQDPLPNFNGVENEIGIGVELRQGTPWTRSVTNLNLDSLRIRMSTPAMSKTNVTNGDITGAYVAYRIELQTDGGPFVTKLSGAFSGKTTSKYERTHRIELPKATTGWVVRVVRVTANSDSASLQNSTFIESYAEIIEAKLRMPMSALVSLIVDAEQFNNIPSRAYRLKGRIIRVPSNYDPDTRQYTGLWDGTFQSRYSNNPAWVFYDMALNDRYGLGHLVPNELVDKWVLYRIGQYCDGLVDDGFGGQEPRFTCNLPLQSQADALKVMQDLATVFRGVIYATGGSVTAVGDMPEDPVYTYTPANVLDGKFVYSGSGRKVRHTVALVSWSDLSDFGRGKVEYVEDEQGIARYGVQETEIVAIGCTSRGQARRWGRYLLATESLETDSVTFGVGLDGTVVAPGKIVEIADPLRAGERRGGRIKEATSTTVTVDLMSVSALPGDTLVVTLPSGVTERRTIQSIAGTLVTVTAPFSAIPVPQSVWAVDSVGIPLRQYRILGVAEDKGERLGYVLHGIEHVNGKFAYADTGVLLESPPVPGVQTGAIPAPTGLTVTHRDVADQNTTVKVVNLSWDHVFVANSYNVLWRQSNGSWVDLGTTGFNNIDITGIMPGGFEVQVMAINALGVRSVPAFGGPYDIPPVGTPPGYVEEINNNISQEIIDRLNGDADVAAAAAADATAKANAALIAANAYADVIGAQVADILEADEWNATDTYPIGDLIQYDGKLYRALVENTNEQPDINPDDWQLIGNYASLGEAVAASISMGTQNASDIEAVSTTLTAVVARMPAGSGELATTAMVAAEATARVDGDEAAALRLDVLEARMPSGTGLLATASALSSLDVRVTNNEGQLASQSSALTALTARVDNTESDISGLGSAITLLDTRVTSAEGEISSNSSAITALSAQLGGGIGGNRLVNPTFMSGTTTGWIGTHALTGAYSPRLGGYHILVAPGAGQRAIYSADTLNGENVAQQGEVSTFAATVNADGAWRLVIQYRNSGGGVVGETFSPMQPSTAGDWKRISVTSAVAPANTAFIVAGLQATDTTAHARMFQPMLQLGSNATPFIDGKSLQAQASAVTTLDARVTTAEGNITTQASQITSLTSEVAGKASVTALTALTTRVSTVEAAGYGVNLIPNSLLLPDATLWAYDIGPGSTFGIPAINAAGSDWVPPGMRNWGVTSGGTPNSSLYINMRSARAAVTELQAYIASTYVATHRGQAQLYIEWLDAAGGVMTYTVGPQIVDGDAGGGQALNGWARLQLPGSAPAGARFARVLVQARGNGQTDPYIWMLRPMLEQARTGQTQASPWNAGGFEAQATYTLRLDVNGYVTGWNFVNNGSSSNFDIVVDNFRIVAPSGGARTEFSGGNWRVYDAGGVLRVRMGVW